MTRPSVTLVDAETRTVGPWGRFSTVRDAMRFKVDQQLGAEWEIDDPRDEAERDRLAQACSLIIDILRPFWRARQFDRLARGEIIRMPDCDSSELSRETTMALSHIFTLSNLEGWAPMTGALLRRDGTGQLHNWLQHESGRILDLCDPDAGRLGYSDNDPDDGSESRYFTAGELFAEDDLANPQGWANRVTLELISKVSAILNVTSDPIPECEICT